MADSLAETRHGSITAQNHQNNSMEKRKGSFLSEEEWQKYTLVIINIDTVISLQIITKRKDLTVKIDIIFLHV